MSGVLAILFFPIVIGVIVFMVATGSRGGAGSDSGGWYGFGSDDSGSWGSDSWSDSSGDSSGSD